MRKLLWVPVFLALSISTPSHAATAPKTPLVPKAKLALKEKTYKATLAGFELRCTPYIFADGLITRCIVVGKAATPAKKPAAGAA